MVSSAGPVETGPAGFSALCPLKRSLGPEQVAAAVEADRQRGKAANGHGTPLTGEEGKKWIYKVFYDILLFKE